jgi:hypothetical protein
MRLHFLFGLKRFPILLGLIPQGLVTPSSLSFRFSVFYFSLENIDLSTQLCHD